MKKNIFSRIVAIALVAISVMAIAIPAFAATGKTNTSAVNIRSGPSTSSSLVGQVAKGTTFTIDGEVTGSAIDGNTTWLKISNIQCAAGSKHNITGKSGYVHTKFVEGYTPSGGGSGTGTGSETPTPTGAYINKNAVNIRSTPSTSGSLIGQVNEKTTLEVLGTAQGTVLSGSNLWYNVKVIKCASGSKHQINGKVGYVHSSFVNGYTPSSSSQGHPQTIEQAFGDATLKYGSKGNYVKNLQMALKEAKCLDASEPIDGIFGAKTTAAVEKFQWDYRYLLEENEYDDPVDGLVGPKTKKALWKVCGSYLQQNGVK